MYGIATGARVSEANRFEYRSIFQAHRVQGETVQACIGPENRVMIYDASGRQSLRGDIVNTIATRAQSLALIVGDTNAVRRNIGLEHGTDSYSTNFQ